MRNRVFFGVILLSVLFVAACSAPATQEAAIIQNNDQGATSPTEELQQNTNAELQDDSLEDTSTTPPSQQDNTQPSESDSDTSTGYQGQVLAGTSVPYIDFNEADFLKAQAEGNTVLLNFYATWCPSCKKELGNAYEYYNNVEGENLVAFRVNYRDSDTDSVETALAREHGVATQGTKVIIQDGERVFKTPTHWSTSEYEEHLAPYIV